MIPPGVFPHLTAGNYIVTSPTSRAYNCIAWAAGDRDTWWWPDDSNIGYWPSGVPRHETIDAFVAAYRSLGYEIASDTGLEVGFEKIVIYALQERPTHAARQLTSGRWSSKLGIQEDIEHELEALEGPAYGTVAVVLRRPRAGDDPTW